jgi:hypothetical protein
MLTVQQLLALVYHCAEKGDHDGAIDWIFETIARWGLAGRFDVVDQALRLVDLSKVDTSTAVAFLTITRGGWKSMVPYRDDFLTKVEAKLWETKTAKLVEAVLRGLR